MSNLSCQCQNLFIRNRKSFINLSLTFFVSAAAFLTHLIAGAYPGARTGGDWQIETVGGAGGTMNRTSIAVDDVDFPHISYTLANLMYTFKDGSGWHTTKRQDFGQEPSLALDSMGYPHICYRLSTSMDYQYQDESGWHSMWIYRFVDGNSYCSIAVDQANYPRFSFYDGRVAGNLVYTYEDAGGWHIDNPDSALQIGLYSSLALDSNDYPHISYYGSDKSELKYAYQDGTGWHPDTVDSIGLVGTHTSLALDNKDYPHISYFDCGTSTNPSCSSYDLKYTYHDGSSWHTETVDSDGQVGRYTSIALDASGYPHISYRDTGNGDLKYAYQDSTGWHIETIDSAGDVGTYTSLALGKYDSVHISYFDNANRQLKYAYKEGAPPEMQLIYLPMATSGRPPN